VSRHDLVIAGAGMAGLAAAAQARVRGARPLVLEKGDRVGGSMLLSSGVIWRYRDFDRFRAECPGGDEALQRLVHLHLDRDLAWLVDLGVIPVAADTGNSDTVGVRFDPASVARALAGQADVRLGEPLRELPPGRPVILATGGFHAGVGLVREHVTREAEHLLLRGNPWSTGDGLRLGLAAGGAATAGMDEIYGRAMPAPPAVVREVDLVPLAQLYARWARIEGAADERFTSTTWSEIDVVQWLARRPGARGRFVVSTDALEIRPREASIGEMIDRAERAGAVVVRADGTVTVEVVAGITSTLGGLGIDPHARVTGAAGVFAAGADVGGIATGGYASGLAAALVLGRIAADAALGLG
jgi:succinate dehydrogenase/fumarate reductase flavoprotein subunit